MNTTKAAASGIDLEKYRLRRFVNRLIDMGEVEVHDEPVPLTGLGAIIERTEKAVLFKSAGPERAEIVAKTAASRKRLIAAFETTEEKIYDEYFNRLANPKPVVEIPSSDAPVHTIQITGKDVDLTKLPFYPHHAYDGSCYLSSATDYTVDPATGRRNVGCRRLSLRNRYETGTNVTAPSDLKRIYIAEANAGFKPYPNNPGLSSWGSWAALDAATGQTIWQMSDPNPSFDLGAVSVSNGVMFAGSMSGHMYAINAATGTVLKDVVGQGSSNAGPAIDNNGVVYWGNGYARFGFGAGSTTFYALSVDGK